MSKPRSLSRSTRSLMRQRSGLSKVSLPVREAAGVELAGLGVDEVRGERARVATEERVRQRHVAPVEADHVQAHEQQRERVDEAGRRLRPQRLRVEGAVGQRELEVPGDEHGVQQAAVDVVPVRDDGERVDAGDVHPLQGAEHLVLAAGHLARGLLDRDDVAAEVREADEVPRDALRQGRDRVVGPLVEGQRPGQVEEGRVGRGGRDVEGVAHGRFQGVAGPGEFGRGGPPSGRAAGTAGASVAGGAGRVTQELRPRTAERPAEACGALLRTVSTGRSGCR